MLMPAKVVPESCPFGFFRRGMKKPPEVRSRMLTRTFRTIVAILFGGEGSMTRDGMHSGMMSVFLCRSDFEGQAKSNEHCGSGFKWSVRSFGEGSCPLRFLCSFWKARGNKMN